MKYSNYINEVMNRRPRGAIKLKELDVPLTDSEIKKLEAFRNKMKKGSKVTRHDTEKKFGLDALKPNEKVLYDNLLKREKVKPKAYELKTMAQIKKSKSLRSTLLGFLYLSKNSPVKRYLKYTDRFEKLKEKDYDAYISEYMLKAQRIVKSKAFKDLAIKCLEDDVLQNDYNLDIDESIRKWAIDLIKKDGIDTIVRYDGYKLYQDLVIDTSSESWTSYQGASMTTKKATVKFTGIEGNHEKEFDLGTSGYWNE